MLFNRLIRTLKGGSVSDAFNAPNNTPINGRTTDTGGLQWSIVAGTAANAYIMFDKMYLVAGGIDAVLPIGSPFVDVKVDELHLYNGRIYLRYIDASNWVALHVYASNSNTYCNGTYYQNCINATACGGGCPSSYCNSGECSASPTCPSTPTGIPCSGGGTCTNYSVVGCHTSACSYVCGSTTTYFYSVEKCVAGTVTVLQTWSTSVGGTSSEAIIDETNTITVKHDVSVFGTVAGVTDHQSSYRVGIGSVSGLYADNFIASTV